MPVSAPIIGPKTETEAGTEGKRFVYKRHEPENTALYGIVQQHL